MLIFNITQNTQCQKRIQDQVDFRVFDSVGKLLVRSPRSGFITLSRLPTASFLACTRTPCIIYVLGCIYVHTSERLDGEQSLTADGLGTPFARAQPRLGKHLQHSLNVRILCIYSAPAINGTSVKMHGAATLRESKIASRCLKIEMGLFLFPIFVIFISLF